MAGMYNIRTIRYSNDVKVEPPPLSDWSRPGRIAARLARHLEVSLVELELSVPQYRILMFLSERAEMASHLADSLAVSRPSVTAVVDGLVARGLVERRACLDDRRRVEHLLTPAGQQLLRAADDQVDSRLSAVSAEVGAEHADDALMALQKWRVALDAYAAAKRAAKLAAKGVAR
jgi:long-chain acyl-CoA synthetase